MTGDAANNDNGPNFQVTVIPVAGPEYAEIEILLKNYEDFPLHFDFSTSQMFEISIIDQAGKEVYLYSKGRYFLQALQTVKIEPKKALKRIERWDYQVNGKRVPEGEYTVNVTVIPKKLNDEPIKNRKRLASSRKMYVPPENTAFRKVKVEGQQGHYLITGEARPKNGVFFYSVEDGHNEYIREKKLRTTGQNSDWEHFKIEIQLDEKKLPAQGTLLLNLYERTNKNLLRNTYPVILEKFN
jgi:hypothetical protein